MSSFYGKISINGSGSGGDDSGGGGGEPVVTIPQKVNFVDYEGTVVHSYTRDEALALTTLPQNPTHSGLIAQGWNWTLENIQSYLIEYPNPNADVNVGQIYTTDTGETRLYIYIDPSTPASRMTFYVRFTSSEDNNVTIDWGDGTTEIKGSTTATNYPHTYSTTGEYVIKLKVNSGTISFEGTNETNNENSIYGSRNQVDSYLRGRIRRVEIGDNVTTIGDYIFSNCYSLTSVILSDEVTTIGGEAFYNCRSLTYINIPSRVTTISSDVFNECCSLTSLTISDGVTTIGNNTFNGCYSLTFITIPDGVTIIGDYAFNNCHALTSITIPSGVTTIGGEAFNGCYSLTSITIPSGVTTIDNNTFYGCYSLTSITIPSKVTTIGNGAFRDCSIAEYHMLPVTPPKLSSYVNPFSGIVPDCIIYVPVESLEAYQTAGIWKNYAQHMQEETA